MVKNNILTPQIVADLVRYEPETGLFFWKPRASKYFTKGRYGPEICAKSWNTRHADTEAFTNRDTDGYAISSIFDVTRKAHRVAWAIQTGQWPDKLIDHVNGTKDDNRWRNLRLATPKQNSRNSKNQIATTSRFKGVSLHKRDKVWFSRIWVQGQRIQIGTFQSEEEAALAYDKAAHEHFGAFAKLNFPDAYV